MPLKTRDGVADAPIEPGARTLCEPCEAGRGGTVALDRSLEALADRRAGDLHLVARLEHLDRHALALHRVGEVAAELDEVAIGALDPVPLEVAALGLRDLAVGDGLPRGLWTAS